MSKYTDNYAAMASANGLEYDAANNVIYGKRDGYDLLIYAENKGYPYVMTINTSANRSMSGGLTKEEIKELKQSAKALTNASQDGNVIKATMFLKANAKQPVLQETLGQCISALLSFLGTKGFQPCCSVCGQNTEVSGFKAGLSYMHLCPECESQTRNNIMTITDKQSQPDNVLMGTIGALAGGLLGVLAIVLIGQMGYIAAISGVVMAFASLKLYERLGGNLTIKGIVICVVIMLVMTYVGTNINWALEVSKTLGGAGYKNKSFMDCFLNLTKYLKRYFEKTSMNYYIRDMVLTYAFLLVGAIPAIYAKVTERKAKGTMTRIGRSNNFM